MTGEALRGRSPTLPGSIPIAASSPARALAEEAVGICREVGDRQGETWATARLGIIAYWAGDPAKAAPLLERALAMSREMGDDLGTGWWLLMLGQVCFALGQLERAMALEVECAQRTRELGDRRDYAFAIQLQARDPALSRLHRAGSGEPSGGRSYLC